MSELQTSTVQDFFPFYAIGHQPSRIFGFLWYYFQQNLAINAFSDIENIKRNFAVNQSFPTTVCLLSLSARAGLWCAIWPQCWKTSSQKSTYFFYSLNPLVTVQTVAWQVKNFGAETTTALSRQKSGWKWERKYGKWISYTSLRKD